MKIALAPLLTLLAPKEGVDKVILNLFLYKLPNYVVVFLPVDWDKKVYSNEAILYSYDLFRLLSGIDYEPYQFSHKAQYINTNPDILFNLSDEPLKYTRQALNKLYLQSDSFKIFAGSDTNTEDFEIILDGKSEKARNFNPKGSNSLEGLLHSLEPKLKQLKHFKNPRYDGPREVSSFSAYDRNDESYAKELLLRAYEDYPGNVDGQTTDLYTFDLKNRTFVKFWASRNNEFHGMDISDDYARKHASWVVKKYHQ